MTSKMAKIIQTEQDITTTHPAMVIILIPMDGKRENGTLFRSTGLT